MTETTEEKEYTGEELQEILGKSCAAIANSNAPSAAIENLTTILDVLADQSSKIQKLNNELEDQVTSLTKERDELKNKIDPNEYYGTKCSECGWEGSSKFLRVSQFDECDVTCPCCHSKNLVDSNKELNDNQSISNLHEYIDMQEFRISSIKSTSRVIANHNAHLKSQLSNRDKEIKELKSKIDQADTFYFVEDEEQLGSPDDVADYWDCPIGGTLDIQSCKVFFQPTQTYIRTEEGMVPIQSKEGEE